MARGYKALADVERGFRDLKQLDLRPVYHRRSDRVIAHIQLCWLAVLLIRVAEIEVGDTWRNIATELQRLQLVTLATDERTVAQRSFIRPRQREILDALQLDEPPRYFDFDPTGG